jgi:signal transduction histidine kinase
VSPNPPEKLPRLRSPLYGRGLAYLALLITLMITGGLFQYSTTESERRGQERFRLRTEQQVAALVDRMAGYEQVLKGAAGLFAASDGVSRDQWHDYVGALELDKKLPGIQATGFALVVLKAKLAEHEASVHRDGYGQYAVHPKGDRDVYAPIVFIEPFTGENVGALGEDMYVDPVRREAMDRARDTGRPALSGRVLLGQDSTGTGRAPGFLMYLPVYRHGWWVDNVALRREALAGFVYSPFRAAELLHAVFEPANDLDVEVYDSMGTPTSANLLYESSREQRTARYWRDLPVRIAGHVWIARFHSSRIFEERATSLQPVIILASGVALSLLIFALLYVDASHRARLERLVRERTRELVVARDEAESASRAKSVFLATVSHELRTPLNAIIGFSSVLLQDRPSDEQRKHLSVIHHSGLQLLDLIKEILDLTNIEAGRLAMHLESIPLDQLLKEQCEASYTQTRDSGLTLRHDPCLDEVIVRADRGRLQQIVRNLLSNAIKFTDEGGVVVRCVTHGRMARIEIEDTGIGIPPGQVRALFNPFQRGAGSDARQRSGTGLGLAISRRLVEAMGGEIGVASEVGRGSLFWFTLPRTKA